MRIADMDWQTVEDWVRHDDRAVLPIGSTEQHAFLSLSTDNILAERVAREAAEPLGVPVFPTVNYGITPGFMAYPGTVSLRVETMLALVRDILDSLNHQGFRRILIVNGHGGNSPVQSLASEWMADHPETTIRLHNWWNAPAAWAKVMAIDPVASHASWMENFPWTRLPATAPPDAAKPMPPLEKLRLLDPVRAREFLGDGNFGGRYQRSDADMAALWQVALEETRDLIERGWPDQRSAAGAAMPR
jgi:creatinine amidohydrolase